LARRDAHQLQPRQGQLALRRGGEERTRGPTPDLLALIGDAALATDPLFGVGCGWAFQSGEWLADSIAPALRGDEPLEGGLQRYRRRHRSELRGALRPDPRLLDGAPHKLLRATAVRRRRA
jgi:2-polyprenyl-6-methoxyphenol hydroxylase-like FAD-dependent oxidoreductase